jgi:2,4-dienoyl-CoA reductase-like NADH-dependent reductase (Old Yellow Enzyme family)
VNTSSLFQPLTLPNGATIRNRLAKAAMEENMADSDHAPGTKLWRLYQAWNEGGAGLIITGNVMIDGKAMTGPGGVVLQDSSQLDKFRRWASCAKGLDTHVWMQLNHPGRQVYAAMKQHAIGPSAVAVDIPGFSKMFARPRAMTGAEIQDVIQRFVRAAKLAQQAGFTGVEVHAAHGYLLSQFLSPITNKRTDEWGGSLPNRARLLVEVVKQVRAVVKPGFCVGVKLNSADFQRGGFDAADASEVIGMLNPLGVDLVELSGGSYEAPAMQGQTRDGRTLKREAYFLEFAQQIAKTAKMPLMVTGGIRRREVAEHVIESGIAMAGMATALALDPSLPNLWSQGIDAQASLPAVTWKNKTLSAAATMSLTKLQLDLVSEGKPTHPHASPLCSFLGGQVHTHMLTRQYRRWVASQDAA